MPDPIEVRKVPIESVSDAQQGSKSGNTFASVAIQYGVLFMGGAGQGAAVITRNAGYFMSFRAGEVR